MCSIFFAYDCHSEYKLILAANRDEFYARPTLQAHFWEETPHVLAGKDLEQCGTWLGITRQGKMAALTNYRDPAAQKSEARSRGLLVKDYLRSSLSAVPYLAEVDMTRANYNGFNLLIWERNVLWYYSNRSAGRERRESVKPGVYGLSNHFFDTPWPKVEKGKVALQRCMDSGKGYMIKNLFGILADKEQAPDKDLPVTGVSLAWERLLSSIFIKSADYGTRASTVLLIDWHGNVEFHERSFNSYGEVIDGDKVFHFTMENRP
jgi:uncharacterized protein with NRDE domain